MTVAAALVLSSLPACCAAQRTAREKLDRWVQTLAAAQKASVECRIQRFNFPFQVDEQGIGTYYRKGNDVWAFRLGPAVDAAVSALEPANGRNRKSPTISPMAAISTPDAIWVGSGDPMQFEVLHWPPADADAVENALPRSFAEWMGRRFRWDFRELWSLPHAMPLFLVETSEIDDYELKLRKRSNGDDWLEFRVPLNATQSVRKRIRFARVDAAFHPDKDLPYAISVEDLSGSFRSIYWIHHVRFDDDALIPDDAFAIPTNVLPSPTTHHSPLTTH
jgi:hypothetical protein